MIKEHAPEHYFVSRSNANDYMVTRSDLKSIENRANLYVSVSKIFYGHGAVVSRNNLIGNP